MRNLGGSVGISFVTTLLARLSQKHQAMLSAHTVAGNPPFEMMRRALEGAWRVRGNAAPDALQIACGTAGKDDARHPPQPPSSSAKTSSALRTRPDRRSAFAALVERTNSGAWAST